MRLVNIHCHMLYGVDDGAKDPQTMFKMIDAAYSDGVRVICMTPHHNPAFFRYPVEAALSHFAKAEEYARTKYPDLRLFLGNEMYSYHDSVEDLLTGRCLTLNKTRNVLVEFGPYDDRAAITAGVSRLLTSGYFPVIAHVERYDSLRNKKDSIKDLKKLGAYVQINAASVLGRHGLMIKLYVMGLIKNGIADIVADDSHDLALKKPCLGAAYDVVLRKFGRETADRLFILNPTKMLRDK